MGTRINRLSVKPIVQLEGTSEPNKPFNLYITNVGSGPAIIEDFIVYVDGTPVESNGFHALREALQQYQASKNTDYTWDTAENLLILSPDKRIPILTVVPDGRQEEATTFLKEFLTHTTIRIKYTSIYNEVYEADLIFPKR